MAPVCLVIVKEPIKIVANEKTRTGFHVHIGVGVGCEFTLDEVKKVCMLFIVYECESPHPMLLPRAHSYLSIMLAIVQRNGSLLATAKNM